MFLHALCHISAIFEDIDLKFCTHIYQPLASNILYGLLKKKYFEEEYFEKEKEMLKILESFEIFHNFANPR